jgi:hypothetical protein
MMGSMKPKLKVKHGAGSDATAAVPDPMAKHIKIDAGNKVDGKIAAYKNETSADPKPVVRGPRGIG